MAYIDYYGILGVGKTATQDEIKYGHKIEMYTVEQGEKRDKRQ